MAVKGIDVSKWQGDVDFGKVRGAGYEFVIINAGYGRYISQKDSCFEENYRKAKAAGMDIGAYWYSYAVSAREAEQEAEVFMQAVRGKTFEYPLCYDIEDTSQRGLSKSVIGDMIDAFCGKLERAGYYAAVYSYANFLKDKVPVQCRKRYDVWVAAYGVDKPPYDMEYGMWQYTSTGRVKGVNGDCDCDMAYRDYPAIMKEKGLNGFRKGSGKILDSSGYRYGDKGIGVYAVKKLLGLAYNEGLVKYKLGDHTEFGEGTKDDVDTLLGRWGYERNGIAGEGFIKKLAEELES